MTITWPAAFAMTLALELPLMVAGAPRALRKRTLVDGTLANMLTHPLAWWVHVEGWIPELLGLPPDGMLAWLILEALVVLVEGTVFAAVTRMPKARAFGVALFANAFSASIGLLLG